MSDAVVGARANRVVTELAKLLKAALLNTVEFYPQWAGPETDLKAVLAAGNSAGCVTCGGATEQSFDGVDEYAEPVDGGDHVLQRYGTETLILQVDLWAPSIDDRWTVLGKLEEFFDAGPDSEDGVLLLTLSDGASARLTRTGWRLSDTADTAGNREWRASMDLSAEVDMVAKEYARPLDLVVRLRREDSTEPAPEPNAIGKTLTSDDYRPEG